MVVVAVVVVAVGAVLGNALALLLERRQASDLPFFQERLQFNEFPVVVGFDKVFLHLKLLQIILREFVSP